MEGGGEYNRAVIANVMLLLESCLTGHEMDSKDI